MATEQKLSLNNVLTRIEQADDFEISEIISAVTRRYEKIFPDWEVTFLSLPKNDPEERQRTLQFVVNLYNKNL